MVISFTLFLCWFFIGLLIPIARNFQKKHLAFVFLFVELINSNIPYLLGDAFHFYKITKEPQLYLSFSLYQTLAIPAIYTITIYLYCQAVSLYKKAIILLVSFIVIALFEYLIFRLKLIDSSEVWKVSVLVMYRLLLMYLTVFAFRGFIRMCKK